MIVWLTKMEFNLYVEKVRRKVVVRWFLRAVVEKCKETERAMLQGDSSLVCVAGGV